MQSEPKNSKSWFEQHPVITLFFVCSIFMLIVVCMAESILSYEKTIIDFSTDRYIRLREHKPLLSGVFHDIDYDNVDQLKPKPKDYSFRTDENGFIMPSKIHDKPDLAIVFLGGSTTECLRVDEENRFPYLAGRSIEKNIGLKTNSYNSGVFGNNSLHSLNILLNKVILLKPDIVVMMHNFNDLSVLLHEGTYWNDNVYRSTIYKARPSDILRKIKDSTIPHLYYKLNGIFNFNITSRVENDEFQFNRKRKINIDKEHILGEFRMNLQTFINICEARNITPVLMTQQNALTDDPDIVVTEGLKKLEGQGVDYKALKEIYDMLNQEIRDVGVKNRILVIDLDKAIPKSKDYIYDCGHFNNKGSIFAASVIEKSLRNIIALPKNSAVKIKK